jgi:two-component system cell cycle response regulator DivK
MNVATPPVGVLPGDHPNAARILVAEDERTTLRLFQFQLERSGFEILPFETGTEVVERSVLSPPDLAIFDYNLPGRTGLELIEAFKSDDRLSAIPIIVVTGYRDQALHARLLSAGANDVISKPFSPLRLTDRIKELLGE